MRSQLVGGRPLHHGWDGRPRRALSPTELDVPDIAGARDILADFARAVRAWPERTAISHHTDISYRELAVRINATAARYRAQGYGMAGPPALAGVLVSHTPSVVEHMFAILCAGAVYCPIDAGLPAARIECLAGTLGLDRLYAAATPVAQTNLRIDSFGEMTVVADECPPQAPRVGDPAYVLCTSGSTGDPKPVVVSRHALTVTVRALRNVFMLNPQDRVLQFASLGWDTCLEEILPALTAGATLVFDEEAHSGSFPKFIRMLERQRVTVLDLPTAFWHELVLFMHEEGRPLPERVRMVIIGGERLDPTRLRQWRDLLIPNVRLINTYGCTETTLITHAVQLAGPGTEPEVDVDGAEAPLGRPLSHVRDHLSDEGELLVSGPGLANGYLGLPEATEAAFPMADHGTGPARWFRTGDLVTRGRYGLIYPRGRVDEQVKVLGVRVHPAEVEAQLIAHPAVAAAVVAGEKLLGRTSLVAYVVPAAATTPAELQRHLRERLPTQFIPTRVNLVAALSYTASGKVDRAATQRSALRTDSKGVGR